MCRTVSGYISFTPWVCCAFRSGLRWRSAPCARCCGIGDSLVQVASRHLLRLQKALDQMNVLLHRAVTDITGTTGLAILDAIIKGERDPQKLAANRDHRCKKSAAAIASALKGDWKIEPFFTLRQSLAAWRFNHQLADECLAEIHRLASKLESQTDATTRPPAKRGKQPDAAVRTLLFQKFGVDVTAVDGVNMHVAYTFLTEVGPELSRFASPENFAF
jgi:hypothetical protein